MDLACWQCCYGNSCADRSIRRPIHSDLFPCKTALASCLATVKHVKQEDASNIFQGFSVEPPRRAKHTFAFLSHFQSARNELGSRRVGTFLKDAAKTAGPHCSLASKRAPSECPHKACPSFYRRACLHIRCLFSTEGTNTSPKSVLICP